MHVLFECKVLSSGKCHTRRRYTLYRRVVRKVKEHDGSVYGSRLPEGIHEEVSFLEGDTHCREYYRERLRRTADLCLTRYLGSQVGVRKS